MKSHIKDLYSISKKRKKYILGLMSGTSLDGLDIALCEFSGSGKKTKVELKHFESIPYSDAFKVSIQKIFAKQNIDLQELTLINVEVSNLHADSVLQVLKKWNVLPADVDLLASHGQTVFHAPKRFHMQDGRPNATLQIGDGDHLAVKTGIPTMSDFRQKHIAMGGEGAPLALYGDVFLFSKKGRNRFLLNLGGIANFSFLPSDNDFSKAFATDTGPSNTLMDAWARAEFGQSYDKDATIANAGRVDERLLDILLEHPFFKEEMPKTTGPELFNNTFLQNALNKLPKGMANPFDVMRTLLELTAISATKAIKITELEHCRFKPEVYVSGGGVQNPLLMQRIKELLPSFRIFPIDELGISSDSKEAVLFACLANESLCGITNEKEQIGALPVFGMGKISFPS